MRRTSAEHAGTSLCGESAEKNLPPPVSVSRPPCPRGSVVPFDSIATHSAAKVVPIASVNIPIAIYIQSRRITVFVSRFHTTPIGIYFGHLIGIAIQIPPSLQATSIVAPIVPCECVLGKSEDSADKNDKREH
jgi:hypothetical protein